MWYHLPESRLAGEVRTGPQGRQGSAAERRCGALVSGQDYARQFGELADEFVLESDIHRFACRLLLPHAMPVVATDQCRRLVAGRQPALGPLPRIDVDGRGRPAHPGARPARIDGVAPDLGPAPSTG